jgi:hypothetical protein
VGFQFLIDFINFPAKVNILAVESVQNPFQIRRESMVTPIFATQIFD